MGGSRLINVLLHRFFLMMEEVTLCVGMVLLVVFSLFIVFGIALGQLKTKWSGGNLFSIDRLYNDSSLSYGLLLVEPSLLGINS